MLLQLRAGLLAEAAAASRPAAGAPVRGYPVELAVVRDEHEYVGQLPRMAAYRLAHPGTEVFYMGHAWACWQAVIREDDDGMTIITRTTLQALMDKLESLEEPPGR